MDLLQMLKDDHDRVRKLLAELESFEKEATVKRKNTAAELFMELEIHLRLEEEVLYPSAYPPRDLAMTMEEHRRMKECMKRLKEMSPHGEKYEAEFSLFRTVLERHLEDEENGEFSPTEIIPEKEGAPLGIGDEDYSSAFTSPSE